MERSNLPLPLKRQSLRDALINSPRMDNRTSIQFKHSVRDPGGKLGPSSTRRVDRLQVAGDHLKRRMGHGPKKSNVPFSLNGSKVSALCTVDACVPVTPESVVPGKVRAGSTTLMKSKLLQLQERNGLIEARRRLDRCRIDPDVSAMTSSIKLNIDANDVTGNGKGSSLPGCSAIGPACRDRVPLLDGVYGAEEGHTYQSIGEVLIRDADSKPEARQTGSPPPAAATAPDPDAKQVRSKSRSIFSKLWNLRRTQKALQKDTTTASSKPLAVSDTTQPAENQQLYQCSTQKSSIPLLGSRDSFASDPQNNFRSMMMTMTSFRNDDVTRDEREMSPDSIDDRFYERKRNALEKYRIHSDFANDGSASHRRNNSVEQHSAILTPDLSREPDADDDCLLSSRWNNEISNKTRMCRAGRTYENLCQFDSTIGHQFGFFRENLSIKSHSNVQFDRITPFSTNLYGIWPITGPHESSSHNKACFPGFSIGKVAHRLRFSSPCCGVRMAEIRAVWRKCEVVALISDSVFPRHSLATRQDNNNEDDFAWKLLREDASRLLSNKEPDYFSSSSSSSSCSAQTVQRVAQDREFDGRLLSKRTPKDNEYFERISNQSQTVGSKENYYSKRERNWMTEDFKLSEDYLGPNKTDDSFATAGEDSQDYNHEIKSPCNKETNADESSKLKQPKSIKYNNNTLAVQLVAKEGLDNSARTNNGAGTKPNLLHTKQPSKERVISAIGAETGDGQDQDQVKDAFVRHVETTATPVAPATAASVPPPERSFSSQPPDDPEINTLTSESYIPRMRIIKPKVQTTGHAWETAHSQLNHGNGSRSVENLRDQRNSYPVHLRAEIVPCENVLESDLRDSGSLLLPRLLEASTPSSVIENRTTKEDGGEDDRELEFREINACTSPSQSSDLSNSEYKSLSNSRYLEKSDNEITADSCVVLQPSGVGKCAPSGNKTVDPSGSKRRRGKSQLVAPRTDATRCRQQIEKIRLEAAIHAKHEIHQNS